MFIEKDEKRVNLCSPRTDDFRDAKSGKEGIPPQVKTYHLHVNTSRKARLAAFPACGRVRPPSRSNMVDNLNGSALIQKGGEVKIVYGQEHVKGPQYGK
jgi:hypothetical protein